MMVFTRSENPFDLLRELTIYPADLKNLRDEAPAASPCQELQQSDRSFARRDGKNACNRIDVLVMFFS
jgi:hypothetical protein